MLSFLLSEAAALIRVVQAVALFALMTAFAPAALHGAESRPEPRIVALHGLEAAEVRSQGFTLPRPMKVHVYAKGVGLRFFAHGWILNATTREVVWQMDGMNTKRNWEYRVSDQYLDLPAGSYEAYFSNHGFGQGLLFAQWFRNIDRRSLAAVQEDRHHRFLQAIGADDASLVRHWREQVGNYGMEIYLPSGDPKEINLFEAPLRWRNIVLSLAATTDDGQSQPAAQRGNHRQRAADARRRLDHRCTHPHPGLGDEHGEVQVRRGGHEEPAPGGDHPAARRRLRGHLHHR